MSKIVVQGHSSRHCVSSGVDGSIYVCPGRQAGLSSNTHGLHCRRRDKSYTVLNGIPDFIGNDLAQLSHPIFRKLRLIDRIAPLYEPRLWYPAVLAIASGVGSISLTGLQNLISGMLGLVEGMVVDVGCGPGTLGRRMAAQSSQDISRGMLQQGAAYARRELVSNSCFGRAQVEALPFGDSTFNAAICRACRVC
jgi:2-polyprenyl-3-methyl-5-hydroxy-6-metoxy-1,4-benzoquinol methylase